MYALTSLAGYPVTAGFDAPLQVARWRVIGNPIMAIPHMIFLYVLGIVAEVLVLIGWFAALFTTRVPDGIANFVAGYLRYRYRVTTFYAFLREHYPAFEVPSGYPEPGGDPPTWLNIVPPARLSRLSVFFRFILIIPQALWGFVLAIGLYAVMIVAFFAVLFTGRWSPGMRSFVLRVTFWSLRVEAWYLLLADPYPPFTLG